MAFIRVNERLDVPQKKFKLTEMSIRVYQVYNPSLGLRMVMIELDTECKYIGSDKLSTTFLLQQMEKYEELIDESRVVWNFRKQGPNPFCDIAIYESKIQNFQTTVLTVLCKIREKSTMTISDMHLVNRPAQNLEFKVDFLSQTVAGSDEES